MFNVEDALKERSQNLLDEIEDLEIKVKKDNQDLKDLEEKNEVEPSLDKDEAITSLKLTIEMSNK